MTIVAPGPLRRLAQDPRDGVRRLEGRDDPLLLREGVERGERLVVGDALVARPPERGEVRVLGADGRVVEAGRDGVRREDLPVLVGEEERPRPVEDADAPRPEAGRVLARARRTAPAGLDADELDAGVREERVEEADRVRAAADAGDEEVGESRRATFRALRARLAADDGVEVAHHRRVGVRAEDRAEDVVRVGVRSRPSRASPR